MRRPIWNSPIFCSAYFFHSSIYAMLSEYARPKNGQTFFLIPDLIFVQYELLPSFTCGRLVSGRRASVHLWHKYEYLMSIQSPTIILTHNSHKREYDQTRTQQKKKNEPKKYSTANEKMELHQNKNTDKNSVLSNKLWIMCESEALEIEHCSKPLVKCTKRLFAHSNTHTQHTHIRTDINAARNMVDPHTHSPFIHSLPSHLYSEEVRIEE